MVVNTLAEDYLKRMNGESMTRTEKLASPAEDQEAVVAPPTTERKYKLRSEDVHNWDHLPVVEGQVASKGSQKIGKDDRAYLLIDTGTFVARVYESTALEELFKVVEVGDCVYLESLGTFATKQAGRMFRRFKFRVWTE